MTRGKRWTAEQEQELRALVESDMHIEAVAEKLGKTPEAVYVKCLRMGLRIRTGGYIDPSVPMPKELPSAEDVLRMMAGAMSIAAKPGIDKTEVQRLNVMAILSKGYRESLAEYTNYRQMEAKLKEMEEQIAKLLRERAQNDAAKQAT